MSLSIEEKAKRKNKVKGFTSVPRTSLKYMTTSTNKGTVVQFVAANEVKKPILNKEGKPTKKTETVIYSARKIHHNPKTERINKFVSILDKLGATADYIATCLRTLNIR